MTAAPSPGHVRPTIAVHGGAGVPTPDRLAPAQRAAVRAGLRVALAAMPRTMPP